MQQSLRSTINIAAHVDPDILFDACRRYAGLLSGRVAASLDFRVEDGLEGRRQICIDPAEGLPFAVHVIYRDNEPVLTQAEADTLAEEGCGDPDCDNDHSLVEPFQVLVHLACPLDYGDSRGWNAGDLHAALLRNICDFLDGNRMPYRWWENLTGFFHDDIEDADELSGAVARVKAMPQNPLAVLISQMFGL